MLTTDLPRVQPHDVDAERAILSAITLDSAALSKAQELISVTDFYDSRHRRVFEAMEKLVRDGEYVDLLTVGDALAQAGELDRIGGRAGLAEITGTVGSSAGIRHHCRIIRDHAIRRELIKMAARVSQCAYESEPVEPLLEGAGRSLLELTTGRAERDWCPLADVASDVVRYVDSLSKRRGQPIGIQTGYRELDNLLGGWHPSDLIVVAGRPGMGKTSLVLGSALAAAEAGRRVGIFSLEMSQRQLGLRLLGMAASIDIQALRNGSMTRACWDSIADAATGLEVLPIHFDDSALLTPERLAAKARHLKATGGLDLLVLDYLQLLQFPGAETRQEGVADAARRLKLLAKELDIPVIILSQLSRACETRGADRRPMLSDLRESGAIEQDADIVLFLYREEVYTPDTVEKGVAEVLVRKHRNGPTGERNLRFIDQYSRFEDP
jgi:replicative DNA helicase